MAKVKHFNIGDFFQNGELSYEILDKTLLKAKDYVYRLSCPRCKELSPKLEEWELLWNHNNRSRYKSGTLKLCFCSDRFKGGESQIYSLAEALTSKNVSLNGQVSEFKGVQTRFSLTCSVHDSVETTMSGIQRHGGCGKCSSEEVIKLRGADYKEPFEKLTEGRRISYRGWEGVGAYYDIKCTCGKNYTTTAARVLEGRKCKSCGNSNIKSVTKGRVGLTVSGYKILGIVKDPTVRDTKYVLSCNICSKDTELYPYGSVTSNWGNLNSGQKCCGCSDYPQYKSGQIKVLINRVIRGSGYELLGVDNVGSISKARLNLVCPKGHEITSSYHNFKKGHRCKQCYILEDQSFGLYPKRVDEQDWLYLIRIGEFLKVGRSFDLKSRIRDYTRVFSDVEVLGVYTRNHQEVYDSECQILKDFNHSRYFPEETFGGYTECLNLDTVNEVVELLDSASRLGRYEYE